MNDRIDQYRSFVGNRAKSLRQWFFQMFVDLDNRLKCIRNIRFNLVPGVSFGVQFRQDRTSYRPAAFRLGKVCLLLGDYAAARTALLASEQLEPADKSTPILLGRVLTLLGDFAEAESRLTRAAREAPHDHEIAFLLARAVFELGDARRARGELDRALSLGRRDASTQLLSGLIYERLSDLARAAEALRSAVQLEPSDLAGHRALLRVTLAAERPT